MSNLTQLSTKLAAHTDADEKGWTEAAAYEEAARAANRQAITAGRIRVRAMTSKVLESDRIPAAEKSVAVRDAWIELLLSSDDTWSGRTNDAARSYMDGIRDEIQSLRYAL